MAFGDTVVGLGGFVFTDDFSTPQSINAGGSQRMVVHKFIGGTRIIDALGGDDEEVTWAGRFRGAAAVTSCELLDVMRRSGKPVLLTYWTVLKSVVVKKFTWHLERFYECPYTIELEVLQDLQAARWATVATTIDDIFGADASLGSVLSSGTAALNNAMAVVLTAKAAAGSLEGLTSGQISGVAGAVTALAAAAAIAVVGGSAAVSAVASILPGADAAAGMAGLAAAPGQMFGSAAGVQLGSVASRMGINLATAAP